MKDNLTEAIACVLRLYSDLQELNPKNELLYLIDVTGPGMFVTDEMWNIRYPPKPNSYKEDTRREIEHYKNDLKKAIREESKKVV